MSDKMKNIIIIGLLLLVLIAGGIIIYLIKPQNKEELKEIQGIVIITGADYVMLETEDEDFLIQNIKGTYDVGTQVKFSYYEKDLDNKVSPKTIKASDEELIKVAEKQDEQNISTNTIPETPEENITLEPNLSESETNTETNKPSSSNKEENVPSSNTTSNNESAPNNTSNADTSVISYFNTYKTNLDTGKETNVLKSGFVTIVDFLFYNGTIKGYTFNDLTSSAKLKVLSLALYFDTKIEQYFPGYKESISNTFNKVYTNIKSKIVEAYLNITAKVCTSEPNLCAEAKEGFTELKKNFGLTWAAIKDIAGDGLANLKNWYEIWRET